MAKSADPDQIWIHTVSKGRVYLGSAGPGLSLHKVYPDHLLHNAASDQGLHYSHPATISIGTSSGPSFLNLKMLLVKV